jgi:tRNA(Ile)-lysidine synthase
MIDEKIPAAERDRVPLLADGNHILWIVGYRISWGCRITEQTENVLQVCYQPEGGKNIG